MKDAPEDELHVALNELEQLCRKKGHVPGRWEARAILVPLGRLLLARGEEALGGELERIRTATTASREPWDAAVSEELALACAEHIQGTDPRFLDLPNFDWDYVLTARERLEARVVAARALGAAPPEGLWNQVEEADRRIRSKRPPG